MDIFEKVPVKNFRSAIFDLDGVLTDTAEYHYKAWKKLADELGTPFTRTDNERLKGVSRMESLDILLSLGDLSVSAEEKQALAERKNGYYRSLLAGLTKSDLLPGAAELLKALRERGIAIGLGSASRNAPMILEKLGIRGWFDAVVDGSMVKKAKPEPDVFVLCARMLRKEPSECVVFEDAAAGIEAAQRGGMFAVGVGSRRALPKADWVFPDLRDREGIMTLFAGR
jgi:beta-phosphoglucomutase